MALAEYRAEGGIATITLNNPPANLYTHEMMLDLDKAILQARFDDNVHAIVLTGMGDKFFCAGADIKMLASVTPKFKYFFCLHANETLSRLEQTPKLVIAACNGITVGGGLVIAMAADIRIGRKGGGKVGLPEVNLGVLPGTGGTQRIARIVGKSRAIEMMTSGRLCAFEEAQQYGLMDFLYEAPDTATFLSKVHEYAKQFVPPNKAAKAVGLIKRSVQSGAEVAFEYGLAMEREFQAQLFASEDAKEGLNAYVEKRPAKFKGT
ncbi:MAG: enoyl-CoA hydratase/isomerase family protein [Planctomycetes bacterium]|nr:enoyl-CoA hydratase/isomerase family protein [Planctomycetota bacterium]